MAVSNGPDGDIITENCLLNEIAIPSRTYGDVAKLFTDALGEERHVDSCTLCERFGLLDSGRDHDAVADARGIAAVLRKFHHPRLG